jgi:ketosteroid isomerase-like protein
MAHENVTLARDVLDALERRDVDHLVTLSDPDVEWHSFFAEVAMGKGGGYRGHDGIRQYVSDLNDAWEIVRGEVDDALGVGDIALLVGRIHYRGKTSGVETASPAGWIFRFRRERVVLFRAFRDPDQALVASLSEQDAPS